jgi:anti-sigma-K factor RskA
MSGCEEHGELIAGYVLGALDPDEEEFMRRHLETCSRCADEHSRLAGLPALLDRIEPAEVPPPALSPTLEERVLDRVARERRAQRKRRRFAVARPRRVAPVAAVAAVALVALVVSISLLGGDSGSEVYAQAELRGVGAASAAHAQADVSQVHGGTRVQLHAAGLGGGREAFYELWCVRDDGRWVSGGTFQADAGAADVALTAAVQPGDYELLVVTRPLGETDHGRAVMRGRLVY